ncbi:MAG: hypothetical protein LBT09_05640 [Planctomycetaceae bacterium]|jgi:hypothetical protein|nr:hypothetical protein [Planctomycetaceae bacterium]
MLLSEEYVEQAFFFESFIESIETGTPTQEFLHSIRGELLTTAQLHKAVDFMLTDAKYTGVLASSMCRLDHYFSPFQTFIISESEREDGRLDFKIALQILAREAKYRSNKPTTQGVFFYQFETICRNRLGYVRGLDMLIRDDFYDTDWKDWLKILRRQIGFVSLADMIFYRSEYYEIYQTQINFRRSQNVKTDSSISKRTNVKDVLDLNNSENYQAYNSNYANKNCPENNSDNSNNRYENNNFCNKNSYDKSVSDDSVSDNEKDVELFDLLSCGSDVVKLFGEREGRIAFATRAKEPAYLFSALSRHLGYPSVPRQKNVTENENILPLLKRRIEQLENRIQLIEEEQRGGINLNKYIKE